MKQILLLAFIFCSMSLSAQSLIVTTSGQPITGYDVTVTPNAIFYRATESTESQFLKIATDSVSLVRHGDGTILNVSEQASTPVTPQSTLAADTPQTAAPNDYLDHEYNKAMIAKYNTPAEIVFEKESDKKNDANLVAFQHYATEDSQFASKDLIVSYYFTLETNPANEDIYYTRNHIGLMWNGMEVFEMQMVHIKLENKSDEKIYIDLANTFLIRDGVSEPYYVPSAVSSTNGGTSGTSVNLGGIARAAGVGGAAGALAGAVNVSKSKSSYTTNTTYSQRVIIIPPHSTYKLDGKNLIYKNTTGVNSFSAHRLKGSGSRKYIFFKPELGFERIGDTLEWNEENTPYKISTFLTYSLSEDLSNNYYLKSSLYMGIGIAQNSIYDNFYGQKGYRLIPKLNVDDNIIVFKSAGWRND